MSSGPQRICWNCGGIVPGKVQFCPTCNSLQKAIAEEMLAEPRTRGTTNINAFVIGALALALVIGLIVVLSMGRKAPAERGSKIKTVEQPSEAVKSPNEVTPAQRDVAPGGADS